MRGFDAEMTGRQVRCRREHVSTEEDGVQNEVTYPWLLPSWAWQEGLWPPLRGDGPGSLQAYLTASRVRPHSGVHNLKSSWVSGVNLYFPFGGSEGGRALLAGFLREQVDARSRSVESLDLEWAGDRELNPRTLLGETGGARGAGQTSPDLALRPNGGEGLLLVENKLAEHSFYPLPRRRRRLPVHPGAARLDAARRADAAAQPRDHAGQAQHDRRGVLQRVRHRHPRADRQAGRACSRPGCLGDRGGLSGRGRAQNGAGTSYAAGLARAYGGGGYTDWFLPSKDELGKLCENRVAIGGFDTSETWPRYCSSSETNQYGMWAWFFSEGYSYGEGKSEAVRVRAVRAF